MAYRRSTGAMLITEPTPAERLFEMSVQLARVEMLALPDDMFRNPYPTITIRANVESGAVELAASMKSKRVVE